MSEKARVTTNEQAYVCPTCRRVLVVCARLAAPPWCTHCSRSLTEAPLHVQPGQMALFKGRG